MERLLGLELTQAHFDRGAAFIAGVIERAGRPGLDRLWDSAETLPTPNEVDAPGLWLARLDLPLIAGHDDPIDTAIPDDLGELGDFGDPS